MSNYDTYHEKLHLFISVWGGLESGIFKNIQIVQEIPQEQIVRHVSTGDLETLETRVQLAILL